MFIPIVSNIMVHSQSDIARDIADPWYTGNFDVTYEDVKEGCEAFLQYLIENEPLY